MSNDVKDLSGVSSTDSDNPFDALIESTHNHPASIQSRYDAHRQTRNAQQKEALLSPSFSGAILDPIFLRVISPSLEPGFQDPRHCLVFWARPPRKVKTLVAEVQKRLKDAAPHLWMMPLDRLHVNTFEITHSRTKEEIDRLATTLAPAAASITDYPLTHRARLTRPLLGYDAAAVALTYVPASGAEPTRYAGRRKEEDDYTYHHLRRDLHALCTETGVQLDQRYTVPSAHLTVARFVGQEDFGSSASASGSDSGSGGGGGGGGEGGSGDGGEKGVEIDRAKVEGYVNALEEINEWLVREYWPREGEEVREGAEWIVGEEVGLDFRRGTLWYGGGETIRLGKGF